MGLVKFDFLGLKTLTVIDIGAPVREPRSVFDISAIALDDQPVFAMLTGHTSGVQCKARG